VDCGDSAILIHEFAFHFHSRKTLLVCLKRGWVTMVSCLLSHYVFPCNLIVTLHAKYEMLKRSMIHGLILTLLRKIVNSSSNSK
jgi:hypothetical protein